MPKNNVLIPLDGSPFSLQILPLADRHVRLDGIGYICDFWPRTRQNIACLLVHDADCHDLGVFHQLSGQLVVASARH